MGSVSPAPSRLLLDTNVWLDYLLGWRRGQRVAHELVTTALKVGVELLYAVHASKDLFYLVSSDFKRNAPRDENGRLAPGVGEAAQKVAWSCLDLLDEIATAVGCDQSDIWLARKQRSIHGDYEDDLLIAAVRRSGADLLVTSDERLLRHCPVAALDVEDALRYVRSLSDLEDSAIG